MASVLGMLLAGAKKNTKTQLLNTFGMSTEKLVASKFQGALKTINEFQHNPNVTLRSANRIYVDKNRTSCCLTTCLFWKRSIQLNPKTLISNLMLRRQVVK